MFLRAKKGQNPAAQIGPRTKIDHPLNLRPLYNRSTKNSTINPLTVNKEQIMNTIANEPYVWFPNPLRHGPNIDKNKYCTYYKDIGHTT